MTAPQLAPGAIVAQKYRVAAALGYSGSAATYHATTADGREVVLKIFDPGIRQRADIMAAIEQVYAGTNALPPEMAVPLLDAGYDGATGAPFSVVERMPIPSLAQLVAQRPLPPEDFSRVLGVLASLLDQAHRRGLFHHALKPTNVFVSQGQIPTVRVADFGAGLARAAVPTQEGYALAAPWLAPELVQGGVQAGPGADVFSLGLLTFFALTGRSYWRSCQGPLDLAAWQQELLGPRAPASARARELGVSLAASFDTVLAGALAVDPAQRFRSVAELAQAFEAVGGAHPGDNQATMAFPASALGLHGSSGDYPPPPPPTGGYQPAPGAPGGQRVPGQAYPTLQHPYGLPEQAPQPGAPGTAQYPWNQQPQDLASQQGHQGHPGYPVTQLSPADPAAAQQPGAAYVSMQTPPAQPPPTAPFEQTAVGSRPAEPVLTAPRTAQSRLAPILVGVIALVLLGGGAAAWVVMGRRPATSTSPAASASVASDTPSTSAAAPSDSASAAPAAAGSASAAPADSASAAPAATDAPSANAAAGPSTQSTLACDPDCDEVKVDDNVIDATKPLDLAPGKHVVVASKAGYLTVRETIVVKAGEKVDKTFKLKEKAAAAAGPGPAKPCGKFLKRGAGCK